MVREEVDGFMRWLRSRGAVPTVVALREHFERTRRQELERLAPRLASLPPAARTRVEEVTRLLVEKLLSSPTQQLKAAPDEEAVAADADTLSRLFGLDERAAEERRRTLRDREAAGATAGRPSTPRNR